MNYPPNFLISRTSFRSTNSAPVLKPSNLVGKNLKNRRNKVLTSLKIMKIISPEPGIVQSSTAESKNLSISQENTSAVYSENLNVQLAELKQALFEVRSFGNECCELLTKIIQQKQGKVSKSRPNEQKKSKVKVKSTQKNLLSELRKNMTSLSQKLENNESLLKEQDKNLEEIKSKIEWMLKCEKTQPLTKTESSCLIY